LEDKIMIEHKKRPYPIATLIFAIVSIGYFYVGWSSPVLSLFPEFGFLWTFPAPECVIFCFVVVCFLELFSLKKRQKQADEEVYQLQDQIQELLENRKDLQTKAHTYANHAEKLKLFISDKLLEHIQYDEKYLHFKNIASEVRHNGIISYDKINTYLNRQLALDGMALGTRQELNHAVSSLRYLWDLLDLSTAENIALHIANQVCESEERLFQSELGDTVDSDTQTLTFASETALLRSIARCFGVDAQESEARPGDWLVPGHDSVWIRLYTSDLLFGNENHIVLALENIISNAQFYAGKRKAGRNDKNARIAIELIPVEERIHFRVYNRGPHINDETASKLFQLGFSTRRVKAEHGRGLGLYFVNEIAKGYDGKIVFTNIHNFSDVISIRFGSSDGDITTEVIELVVNDEGMALCRKAGADLSDERLLWRFASALESVEITHQSDQKTHRFDGAVLENGALEDPSQAAHPRWKLQRVSNNSEFELEFIPLDISGVQFELQLPTLNSRIEGTANQINATEMADEVRAISEKFGSIDD
jgi:signal transduction histidine kinase